MLKGEYMAGLSHLPEKELHEYVCVLRERERERERDMYSCIEASTQGKRGERAGQGERKSRSEGKL